jgi:hypothetical protein
MAPLHLVLHYFRYKMTAEVCQYLKGSSSAPRLDGPHVLYIQNDCLSPMMMNMSKKNRPSWILEKWQKKTFFSAVSQHPDHRKGWLF